MTSSFLLVVLLLVVSCVALLRGLKTMSLTERIDQLEHDLASAFARNHIITVELARIKAEREQQQSASAEARRQLETQQLETDAVRQQLPTLQSEVEEFRHRLESQQHDLAAVQSDRDQYQSTCGQLQSDLERTQAAENELRQRLAQGQQQTESLEIALTEKDALLQAQSGDHEAASARVREMESEIARAQQDVGEFREYLQEQLNLESQRRSDLERLIAKLSPFADDQPGDENPDDANVTLPMDELLAANTDDEMDEADGDGQISVYDSHEFGLQD